MDAKNNTLENIPLCRPCISAEEEEAVIEALRSGWLAHGPWNKKFEQAFCDLLEIEHAISVNSCASALLLALLANNIEGEVILPSFTFAASANAIVLAGATPVFCDVALDTRNVDASHIAEQITPKTEAVMIVHYAGQPCEMEPIVELCRNKNLLLIEDSAETLGASWNGRQVGSFGIGCFSFFPTKNITTGEGGMLTTSDPMLADRVRTICSHGIERKKKKIVPWQRSAAMAGYNFRMSNINAALGTVQMSKLEQFNSQRREIAYWYRELIAEKELPFTLPAVRELAEHSYQMFTIRTDPAIRNSLVNALQKQGIEASVHFDPPVHQQTYYQEAFPTRTNLPNTEALTHSLVSLPIYPGMTHAQATRVIEVAQAELT